MLFDSQGTSTTRLYSLSLSKPSRPTDRVISFSSDSLTVPSLWPEKAHNGRYLHLRMPCEDFIAAVRKDTQRHRTRPQPVFARARSEKTHALHIHSSRFISLPSSRAGETFIVLFPRLVPPPELIPSCARFASTTVAGIALPRRQRPRWRHCECTAMDYHEQRLKLTAPVRLPCTECFKGWQHGSRIDPCIIYPPRPVRHRRAADAVQSYT